MSKVTPVNDDKMGNTFGYDPDFKGPMSTKRKCQNVIFFLLFIAFWCVWFFLAFLAISDGCPDNCNTPMRLVFGYDSNGNRCGADGLGKQMFIGLPTEPATTRVCVNGCPSNNSAAGLSLSDTTQVYADLDTICVDSNGKQTTSNPCTSKSIGECLCMLAETNVDCCYLKYPTKEALFKCVPNLSSPGSLSGDSSLQANITGDASNLSAVKDFALNPMGSLATAFAQVVQYWPVLVGSVVVALILGFLWLLFLRMFIKTMVLVTIFGLALALIGITVLLWSKAGQIDLSSNTEAQAAGNEFAGMGMSEEAATALAAIFTVITVVYLLILIVMLKRILIACQVIKEAAKAIAAMPTIVLWPLSTFASVAVLCVWWIIVMAYLASAGDFDATTMTFSMPSTSACVTDVEAKTGASTNTAKKYCSIYKGDVDKSAAAVERAVNGTNGLSLTNSSINDFKALSPVQLNAETYNYFILYHIFGFLWSYAFTLGVSYMVMAGAVASWYWTLNKKNLPLAPVLSSLKRTIRYHMGSVAFGSLILATVQMIRFMFNYIMKKSKKYENNKVVKFFICCVNCCLKCLERFIDFLNKNAYIMIAIHGYGFCKAAKEAFQLLLRNALRVAAINVIGDFMLFLGKLVVAAGTVLIALAYFNAIADDPSLLPENLRPEENAETFPIFPIICCLIIGYGVGSVFMGVFEVSIDTIFLSFCEDSERNDGSPEKPFFMSDSLRWTIGAKKNQVAPGEKSTDEK